MSYYPVGRPTGTPLPIRRLAVLVPAALTLVAFAHAAFTRIPVVVDDREYRVAMGTRVNALDELGLTRDGPGDLVAAGDGTVLVEGAGGGTRLYVDGRSVAAEDRVTRPVEVRSARGADVVERVEVEEVPVAIPVVSDGEGSIVDLAQPGAVGVREISRGSLSGQVVRDEVVEEPTPMVLRRRRPTLTDRVVALTFDDGPWPGQTGRVLEILEAEDVQANFFMLGSLAARYPALTRRVAEAGHTVGNHTYTHSMVARWRRESVAWELRNCQRVVRDATGESPRWFRPPGGLVSSEVWSACADEGLFLIGWTVDPQDWDDRDAERIRREVLAAAEPGAVILLHDGGGDRSATIEALPGIIRGLKERGYMFVTLDEVPALAWQ